LDISTAALIDEKGNDVLILDVTNYDDSVQNITSETNAAGASTVTGGSSLEVTVENLTANGDSFTLALNPMNDTDMHIFVD
jgi:Mrp family chromosome partitioning ATPase